MSFTGSAAFVIGATVHSQDGRCGGIERVIIDPVARSLTHLVVETGGPTSGRLVPIELVQATGTVIQLSCSRAEFDALADSTEKEYLAGDTFSNYAQAAFAENQIAPVALAPIGRGGTGPTVASRLVHVVPLDEIEVDHGAPVEATDGKIGQVHGFVVEPSDHHLTHLILKEGHLWGAKEVTIPITTVTSIDNHGIHLNLSKEQVKGLPALNRTPN